MKNKILVILSLLSIVLLSECASISEIGPFGNVQVVSKTPYASVKELDAITNGTTNCVYWRIARTFALIELESFRDQNSWQNAKLSKYPVLIYDGNSLPKYYEFRVLLGENEVGAISSIVQKKDGKPVQYVMNKPNHYDFKQNNESNLIIIANGYPSGIAYGIINKSGNKIQKAIDPTSGQVTNVIIDTSLDYFLTNATQEELTQIGITNQSQIKQLLAIESSNKQINLLAWQDICLMESNIINITEEQITEGYLSRKSKGYYYTEKVLDYCNSIAIDDGSLGWCGIVGLWWLYNSVNGGASATFNGESSFPFIYYNKYGQPIMPEGTKLLTNVINSFLADGSGIWPEGTLLPGLLPLAMIALTKGNYSISSGPFHSWWWIDNHIRNNNLPGLSLRSGRFDSEGAKDKAWHYRAIYGTSHEHNDWFYLWFTVTWNWIFPNIQMHIDSGWWDNYRYRLHDNGADNNGTTHDYWEADGAAGQFWIYAVVK